MDYSCRDSMSPCRRPCLYRPRWRQCQEGAGEFKEGECRVARPGQCVTGGAGTGSLRRPQVVVVDGEEISVTRLHIRIGLVAGPVYFQDGPAFEIHVDRDSPLCRQRGIHPSSFRRGPSVPDARPPSGPPSDSLVAPGIAELRRPLISSRQLRTPVPVPLRSPPCVRPRDSRPFPLPVEGTREAGGSGVFPLHSHISPLVKSRLVPVNNPSWRPGRFPPRAGVPPAFLLPPLPGPLHPSGGRSGGREMKAICL